MVFLVTVISHVTGSQVTFVTTSRQFSLVETLGSLTLSLWLELLGNGGSEVDVLSLWLELLDPLEPLDELLDELLLDSLTEVLDPSRELLDDTDPLAELDVSQQASPMATTSYLPESSIHLTQAAVPIPATRESCAPHS